MSKSRRISGGKLKQPKKMGIIYIFLLILAISVIKSLFGGNYSGFVLSGIGFLMLLGSATLATKGSEQERKYNEATFSKAPSVPYKKIAAFTLGITVFYLSFIAGGKELFHALFLGILSTIGFLLYYGFDPSKDKLPETDGVSADMVMESLAEANEKLTSIEDNISDISDIVLHGKLGEAIKKSRSILEIIENDPKDIRIARKFLVVYIDGIGKVVDSYTQLDESDIDTDTRDRLYDLLSDIDKKFDKEQERLKENNKFDLDVHMDVLKEQINN